MSSTTFYGLLADFILVVHFAFVAFVVIGLLAIWIGYFCRRRFVRNFTFRSIHLAAMAFVVAESVAGVLCFLTTWEHDLRRLAGEGTYQTSFMQHWIGELMFFDDVDLDTFKVIYIVFFLAMVLSLVIIRPDRPAWLRRPARPDAD